MLTKPYNFYGSIEKYDKHCEAMAVEGTAGTHMELQAASDMFFTIIEIFSTGDFTKPFKMFKPAQLRFLPESACTNRILLLRVSRNHCVALVDSAPPLMPAIFGQQKKN